MVFIFDLFGKKPEKIKFGESCQDEILNPNEGPAKIKCGKPLVIDELTGKKVCSANEEHNINGPDGPKN